MARDAPDSLRRALYLKTLSLVGFKSFADRTHLEFEPGVNVVVGPNGSGKSNLVDAIAWAMGTQATSAMRTQKMDEVIFSGTAVRPAHGRAEVSITFDNSEGRLPLDLAEVTITRRLYRDGTSEYEVNGAGCRLLDIQELLSDSGVGRHQHVIVGQGRIGEILGARPDEHRAVIEEAAGVVKHRNRRERSLRRLEQTALDVARLQDILTEQQRRMRPLRRQARAAERYDEVKAEARALRLWLGGRDLEQITARLEVAGTEHAAGTAQLAADRTELAELESRLSQLEELAGETGRDLERDTAAAARLETAAERLQRTAMVARERRLALETRARGAGDRRRDLEEESSRLAVAHREAIAEETGLRLAAERRERELQVLEDEARLVAAQAQLPMEGVTATVRGDLRGLEAAAERDRREEEAVAQRTAVVVAHLEEERTEAARLEMEIREIDSLVAPAQKTYQAARATRGRDQAALESAEYAQQAAAMEAARAAAKAEALEAALAGFGDPEARDLVAGLPQVTGPLLAALDVPAGLETAVDAVLGAWGDGFAVADAGDIEAAVAGLKASGRGGVAIVASGVSLPDASAVAAEWGCAALTDALGPAADGSLAAALMGDVLLVEGWATALRLVQRHPQLRAVTPEGDLITAAGVRAAVPEGAGPAALEAARIAVEAADTETRRAASLHTSARRAFERSREEERAALEALEALEARLAGATEAFALVERARAAGAAEEARLRERAAALAEAAASRTTRIDELRRRLEALEGEEAARQQEWEAIEERRREVEQRRDAARRHREDAAASLGAVEERRRLMEQRLQDVTAELATLGDRPVDPGRLRRLEALESRARRAVEGVRTHIRALRDRQRELRERAGSAGGRLAEANRRIRTLESGIADLRERLAALDGETAELRVRRESVAEALRREADATEEEALAATAPEGFDELDDPAGHLESLESTLRRLGPVNPLAAAEYRELKERTEFMQAQIDDLEESRRELRKVISALDEQIAVQFRAAFDEIAAHYEEHFKLLFPGGKGRLRLTDPDDLLATGIEIEAQPLGKRIGRLGILSGGERSLAALAFLFAVFRARPSPFYVLDEVEAALDDANLRRFIRLVDTMRGSAQLTIVTHQQHTMEAADMLYGVTMEPGASSQVVAKRLVPVTT